MDRVRMRIGAELRPSDTIETIRNPYDDTPVGEVCVGGPDDMDDAIAASAEAFEITRRMPTHRRVDILETASRLIGDRSEEITVLMARESGKPIRFCRGEVKRAQVTFSLGACEAGRLGGETMPIDLEPRAEGRMCLFERVPRGPVAAIAPFNFPLNLIAHKLSPAIAVGAPVVLKPPPQCPLTGHLLGEILSEAGLPDGALNILHCPPKTAQRMVEDERMKVLSFTGSDTVGWKLKSMAGAKQVLLELGGNAPCIVDAGVELDGILPSLTIGAWANAGQVCIKVQRILVQESLFEDFLERFVAASEQVVCGDPLEDKTVVGPLIEAQHVERVRQWIDEAVSGGATLHCGGEVDGQIITPAVITGATDEMKVRKEEVFGPVTVVEPFDRFEEAIASCNESRFGLQAGVFTRDIERALYAYRTLEYGGVMINDVPTFRVDNFPYGGTKDSGFGREGVRFAMEEMTEPKVLVMRGLPAS